jgi:prepilin-type N-terminal cleavage/methylation domain-containing protein
MNRGGFTLVEVIVGMLILSVGVIGLASSTGYVSLQLQAADLRTDRSMARQQVVESLHAMDFTALDDVDKASGETIGRFTVWWDVESLRWAIKEVDVYTEGPGFRNGHREASVRDTVTVRIARPN